VGKAWEVGDNFFEDLEWHIKWEYDNNNMIIMG
jgi:hypothetical protein